jgi:hypothetical protein
MKSKSIKGKSTEEIKSALGQSIEDGFTPTLAIIFMSIKQDRGVICKTLGDLGITVFGATTNGEFIDETSETGGIAILLLDLDPDYFQLDFKAYPEGNYREIATDLAKKGKEAFEKPSYIIACSHLETDGEEILKGFEDVMGDDVNVFGGFAGDDFSFTESAVFSNGFDSNKGMICLALDENKLTINGVATCGWKAMGTEKTVTKSEGNHVYTIDHIPALDITTKYGGLEDVSPDNKNLLMELAANFPLQMQREKGDPVMRPGLVVDWSDRSFFTSGTVPQGSKVRFSVPPDFDVMDKVVKEVENLKDRCMPEADALIVFSCAGRFLSLGPLMPQELEGIKNVWNVPMVGMFSNAELARATGGNLEMHNLTTCCIAIKEK